MEKDLDQIKREYKELLKELADPEIISDWEKFDQLSKKKNYLEKIIEKDEEIKKVKSKIEENKSIISAREDPELISLAEVETNQLQEKEKVLEEELISLLKSEITKEEGKKFFSNSVIVEIRAGAGGEEAALFAADLFKMYLKYANSKNWKKSVLDCHYSDLGGIKQIIFELKGNDVFLKMKYEAGVHRVQRIPITEKTGRIHTSTVSVAVLPKPQKAEIKINPQDLKVDFYKASGPGGQYVNKRMTAVRITHLPSGLMVTSQTERNLQQNKENALNILEAKLLGKKEMEENIKLGKERRSQIGKAQRAEKIRTYNFPQNRVTDHRIKKSFHNIEEIMEGNLEPIIKNLQNNSK